MTEFRRVLYQHYVTSFKSSEYATVDRDWNRAAFRYVYLPLLEGIERKAPLLEIGCGQGLFLQSLGEEGFSSAEGIDISEEQIRLAIQKDVRARVADAIDFLADHTATYAAVIALDFFEHFTVDELFVLLRLIHTALRDGGTLIIRTPNGAGLSPGGVIYGDLSHMTILTPTSIGQLLREFNFGRIVVSEFPPIPWTLKGRCRSALWEIVKLAANIAKRIETGRTQEIWTENMVVHCIK